MMMIGDTQGCCCVCNADQFRGTESSAVTITLWLERAEKGHPGGHLLLLHRQLEEYLWL